MSKNKVVSLFNINFIAFIHMQYMQDKLMNKIKDYLSAQIESIGTIEKADNIKGLQFIIFV